MTVGRSPCKLHLGLGLPCHRPALSSQTFPGSWDKVRVLDFRQRGQGRVKEKDFYTGRAIVVLVYMEIVRQGWAIK